MKVCTDACLFGAWVAKHFEEEQPNHILDIGTGTGLLSLMLAQKLYGGIESIEIDQPAYLQASDNILTSKWKDRISIINADIKTYDSRHSYDLIVSNPPFYQNDLRAAKTTDNMARHSETLTLEALLSVVSFLISDNGSFAAMVPYHRAPFLITTAEHFNLYPFIITHVKPSSNHRYFRSMIVIKKRLAAFIDIKDMSIKEGNEYTPESISLLKDYYLYL